MEKKSINYKSHILIQKFDDGYYAECPSLEGCYTQGFTHEEAVENIKDAIRLHILDRVSTGEDIPASAPIDWTRVKETVTEKTGKLNYDGIFSILEKKGFKLKRESERHKIYQNTMGKRITIPVYFSMKPSN